MRQVKAPDNWHRPIGIKRPVLNVVTSVFALILYYYVLIRMYLSGYERECWAWHKWKLDNELEEIRKGE